MKTSIDYLLSYGNHCSKLGNCQADRSKDIVQTTLDLQTNRPTSWWKTMPPFFNLFLFIVFHGETYFLCPLLKVLHLSVGRFVDQAMSLYILWPLCLKVAKLDTVDAPRKKMFLLIFRSHGQRSRSNCWSLYKCLLNMF